MLGLLGGGRFRELRQGKGVVAGGRRLPGFKFPGVRTENSGACVGIAEFISFKSAVAMVLYAVNLYKLYLSGKGCHPSVNYMVVHLEVWC